MCSTLNSEHTRPFAIWPLAIAMEAPELGTSSMAEQVVDGCNPYAVLTTQRHGKRSRTITPRLSAIALLEP